MMIRDAWLSSMGTPEAAPLTTAMAIRELLNALQQMKSDWSESDDVHQNELWATVHAKASVVRELTGN